MNVSTKNSGIKKWFKDSFIPIVLVSFLGHILLCCGLVYIAKAVYKPRVFERPYTFELVKLQQVFEVPDDPKQAKAPQVTNNPPPTRAAPQEPQKPVEPQPQPLQETTPVPSENKEAQPLQEQVTQSSNTQAATGTSQTQMPGVAGAGDGVSTDKVYEAGMVDEMPVPIKKIEPFYPEFVKDQGISGIVKAQAVIDEKGDVIQVKVLSSPSELLSDEVMKALGRWKYKPGKYKGTPVKVKNRVVEIKFELNE